MRRRTAGRLKIEIDGQRQPPPPQKKKKKKRKKTHGCVPATLIVANFTSWRDDGI